MKTASSEHRTTAKTALKGSIKKWFNVWHGLEEDLGTRNCPLCKIHADNGCGDCAVADATDKDCCDDTPYKKWDNLWDELQYEAHFDPYKNLYASKRQINPDLSEKWSRKFRQTARREFAFLLALLPYAEQDGFLCELRGEYLRNKNRQECLKK